VIAAEEFDYKLKQETVADFEKVEKMVTDNKAKQIIETRPTPYLAIGKIKGSTHVSCNDLVDGNGLAKSQDEVRDLLI